MVENPFRYGSPVPPPYFAGRQSELATVVDHMENGINVVVTAPRRYGKTSLLEQGTERIRTGGGSVVRANLLLCPSFDALAARLTAEAFRLPGGPWRRATQALPEFLRRFRVRPTVTVDDAGHPVFSFAGSLRSVDAGQLIEDVFVLLDELADRHPAVLVLDEFQAVADLDRGLPGLLKALADDHPSVSLVMAGSKHHLMEALVLSRGAPLYNMAERIALGPIPAPVMADFLRARAAAGRRPMTQEAATRIQSLAGPIPYDIQRLAYAAFVEAPASIDGAVVDVALARVVANEAEGYAERFSRVSVGQRRVLLALAALDGVERPQSGAFARLTGYANPAGPAKALATLADDEVVVDRQGKVEVADPFFRAWLRASASA